MQACSLAVIQHSSRKTFSGVIQLGLSLQSIRRLYPATAVIQLGLMSLLRRTAAGAAAGGAIGQRTGPQP
jgi:hypothetical protein